MKTIGLIGGITSESTILYYRILNELSSQKFGTPHSAKVIIHSLDFGIISAHQHKNQWDELNHIMQHAAISLEKAGADCILICANTMHLTIDAVRSSITIPVIHIAEETAKKVSEKGIKKVALLGTTYTMEKHFFKDILTTYGVSCIIPPPQDRAKIHRVIYEELSQGVIKKSSKNYYLNSIQNLIDQGAEGIILGCTEIPMLVEQADVALPVFDTTKIHAKAGFDFASKK